jgi:hypothetical protein
VIVVIADDLSGAAELAGAARAFGLRAEVQTAFHPATDAEVVAVDTDTRTGQPDEAARTVGTVARAVAGAKPEWIYKKTDSVLRGNVAVELRSLMAALRRRRALFAPANPSRQRIIRGGRYFVGGVPLDQTVFAADPDHPRRSADLLELLGGGADVQLLAAGQRPAGDGIHVPDITCRADLAARAAQVDEHTLAAGGVEFFEALLARVVRRPERVGETGFFRLPLPALFVCGSLAAWDNGRAAQCRERDIAVIPFRADPVAWSEDLRAALDARSVACAAIGRPESSPPAGSLGFTGPLIDAVARVLRLSSVGTLLVEGGATATALIRHQGWTRFAALDSPAPGVGVLAPLASDAPRLCCKPGSYDWPDPFWPRSEPEPSR